MAAFFLPPLLVLAPAKPNLAVTVLLTSKGAARWKWIGLSGAILALTMLAWPTWPGDWLANLHDGGERYSGVPVLLLFGLPVLVFIRNPRLPEARALLLLALVPQTHFFYDQLPLWLTTRSWRSSAFLAALSWLALWLADFHQFHMAGLWVPLLLYLPACLLLLIPRSEERRSQTPRVEEPAEVAVSTEEKFAA
jgi:hypothetical protein